MVLTRELMTVEGDHVVLTKVLMMAPDGSVSAYLALADPEVPLMREAGYSEERRWQVCTDIACVAASCQAGHPVCTERPGWDGYTADEGMSGPGWDWRAYYAQQEQGGR